LQGKTVNSNYLAICLKFLKDVAFPITNSAFLTDQSFKLRLVFNDIL